MHAAAAAADVRSDLFLFQPGLRYLVGTNPAVIRLVNPITGNQYTNLGPCSLSDCSLACAELPGCMSFYYAARSGLPGIIPPASCFLYSERDMPSTAKFADAGGMVGQLRTGGWGAESCGGAACCDLQHATMLLTGCHRLYLGAACAASCQLQASETLKRTCLMMLCTAAEAARSCVFTYCLVPYFNSTLFPS